VRELRNVLEMLVVLARGGRIEATNLSTALSRHTAPTTYAGASTRAGICANYNNRR